MVTRRGSWLHLFLAVVCICGTGGVVSVDISVANDPQTYIVQVSKLEKPSVFETHRSWYYSIFSSVRFQPVTTADADADTKTWATVKAPDDVGGILHTYDTVFWGFAARLTKLEAESLESKAGVLKVHPEGVRHLHTTYTPEFMGLNFSAALLSQSQFGEDVIIGMLDTGVWPERKSFSDDGLGDIPSKWRGSCVQELSWDASVCNRKLIGAKYFSKGYEAASGRVNTSVEFRSPRDGDGHGTHTASTAGGTSVNHASLLGFAEGTAKGVAPRARLAIYKVCWENGCYDSDILAAFDEAVADGVDVISLSVGGGVEPYFLDPIAIGAFGAMKKGVFVSCSAGNSGPAPFTVTNIAPWITTVAASTVDRNFPAIVKLGDGKTFRGTSLYSGPGLGESGLLPIVYAGNASRAGVKPNLSALCLEKTLDPQSVKGKIVLCDRGTNPRVAKGEVCKAAGAAGMILANLATDAEGLIADAHILPASAVGAKAGRQILDYVLTSANPRALILFKGTMFGAKPAPVVSSFSSRGPNPETLQILKPDITAPGVNILAAWSGNVGPTGLPTDNRRMDFNIISGTSMSCPHVSGVAALLKGAHPKWSPAAIKSAMMTTAYVSDNAGGTIQDEATGNVTSPFAYGSGHVAPENALDPGLIYEITTSDYVGFFCSLNYSDIAIRLLDPQIRSCPKPLKKSLRDDLNYPSFSALFDQKPGSTRLTTSFKRVVTNVGPETSTYKASVIPPEGVDIEVEPTILKFSKGHKKLTYKVHVVTRPVELPPGTIESAFGVLAWTDGSHVVQSPIVINWQQQS